MFAGKLSSAVGMLCGRFLRIMTITIGGVARDDLLQQVKAVRSMFQHTTKNIDYPMFTTRDRQETVTLIDLSPADLDFTEEPRMDQIDEKRLTEWSATNLDGYIVEFCPAEVGPHLAIQYQAQPKNETLSIAMKQLRDSYAYRVPSLWDGPPTASCGLAATG